MPSPRPVKPSFSLVVAFTPTRSAPIPASLAIFARIASRCAPIRGASHTIVRSRCAMRPFPRPHTVDGKGKEAIGRGAAPLRVARREMGSDITVGECAENCICKCVQGDVGIRMAGEGLRGARCELRRAIT